jgi:hypothetical protein
MVRPRLGNLADWHLMVSLEELVSATSQDMDGKYTLGRGCELRRLEIARDTRLVDGRTIIDAGRIPLVRVIPCLVNRIGGIVRGMVTARIPRSMTGFERCG